MFKFKHLKHYRTKNLDMVRKHITKQKGQNTKRTHPYFLPIIKENKLQFYIHLSQLIRYTDTMMSIKIRTRDFFTFLHSRGLSGSAPPLIRITLVVRIGPTVTLTGSGNHLLIGISILWIESLCSCLNRKVVYRL